MATSPPATPSALAYNAGAPTVLAASYTNIFDDTVPSGCGSVTACELYKSDCTSALDVP